MKKLKFYLCIIFLSLCNLSLIGFGAFDFKTTSVMTSERFTPVITTTYNFLKRDDNEDSFSPIQIDRSTDVMRKTFENDFTAFDAMGKLVDVSKLQDLRIKL